MTDYTHMTKDEMVLRLNIETALKKCYESECTKLEKELEVLEEKFVTLNDKYRELEKEKANVEIEGKLKLNNNLTLLKGANANASALSLENEKLKRQIREQQNELYSQGKKIDSLEHENMKLKAEYGELLTCHNDVKHEHEICTKEIKRLRDKVTNQKTQLVDIQQALLNRNMTIEALTGENDRLKKEVKERRVVFEPTSYLIDIQTKDEEIKTLRKKNLDLKNENEGLKLKYDHLNADLEKKVLDNVELNEQIEKDIQDYNKLFHEKEKLEKELETANERDTDIHIEKLKKLNKCLNDEVNKLKNDYYGVLNKYDNLSKDYNELNDMKLKLASNTQPVYIENLNVTYYANGPIWTNEDNEDVEQTMEM